MSQPQPDAIQHGDPVTPKTLPMARFALAVALWERAGPTGAHDHATSRLITESNETTIPRPSHTHALPPPPSLAQATQSRTSTAQFPASSPLFTSAFAFRCERGCRLPHRDGFLTVVAETRQVERDLRSWRCARSSARRPSFQRCSEPQFDDAAAHFRYAVNERGQRFL